MRRSLLAATLLLPLAMAGLAAAQSSPGAAYTPGPQNINLPPDWQQRYIRYATVDKADRKIIRHLYVNPEAFAVARPGQPLPDGTLIIMADTRARLGADGTPLLDQQGRFIAEPGWLAIAVQEKRAGWGVGYPPEKRNGAWEYARFNGDGSRNNASVEACFSCHIDTRAREDFAFNFWDFVQARK